MGFQSSVGYSYANLEEIGESKEKNVYINTSKKDDINKNSSNRKIDNMNVENLDNDRSYIAQNQNSFSMNNSSYNNINNINSSEIDNKTNSSYETPNIYITKHMISDEEKLMIDRIDKDLLKVNKKSNFTNTNFLNDEIDYIISKEKGTDQMNKSSMISTENNQRKDKGIVYSLFWVLSFCIVTFKSTSDFMVLYASVYLIEDSFDDIYQWQICLIIFFSMLLITPVFFLALNTNSLKLLFISNWFLLICSLALSLVSHWILLIVLMPLVVGVSFYSELFCSKLFQLIYLILQCLSII